jgi:hypothetical protein
MSCRRAVDADSLSLKQTQQLLGSLNNQMCPLIKPFKALMNNFLRSFNSNEQILLSICEQTRGDLLLCARVAETAREGIPIPAQPLKPPLKAIVCYSDVAGSKFAMHNGERKHFCCRPTVDSCKSAIALLQTLLHDLVRPKPLQT